MDDPLRARRGALGGFPPNARDRPQGALARRAGAPAPDRAVSAKARLKGVEEHDIDGVKVRIYSPAKTVADCFKYRRKIGTDVALEALRDCWHSRRCTMDELWRYAAAGRCPDESAENACEIRMDGELRSGKEHHAVSRVRPVAIGAGLS